MKTNLTPDMAISSLSDIKCIRDFFNGGYERQCKEPTCYKYKRGFNINDRFSGTGKHALSLDSNYGYYGSSSCSTFLYVNSKDLFWECFYAWLNANMKTVMLGVADEMQKRLSRFRDCVIAERYRMNTLLERIGGEEKHGENDARGDK